MPILRKLQAIGDFRLHKRVEKHRDYLQSLPDLLLRSGYEPNKVEPCSSIRQFRSKKPLDETTHVMPIAQLLTGQGFRQTPTINRVRRFENDEHHVIVHADDDTGGHVVHLNW